MRRLITLLLLVFYLIPAIGVSIDIHRCGKKVRFVTIGSTHEKKCPCSKKMPAGCCKDVSYLIKLTDNQKTSAALSVNNVLYSKFIAHYFAQITLTPSDVILVFDFTRYHAPPFKNKQEFSLSNSILRI